ncbi:MAG: hypothetical protein J6Y74_06035, partial [Clostridia bacterium]|nr:hypothetical protein [Clostridia bacterium]
MTVRKLLLKNENGAPIAALTLKNERGKTFLSLPKGLSLLAAMTAGRLLEAEKEGPLFAFPAMDSPLSFLVARGADALFATEEKNAAYAKWMLLALQEGKRDAERKSARSENNSQKGESPALPSEAAPLKAAEENATPKAEPEKENGISSDISDISEEKDFAKEEVGNESKADTPAKIGRDEMTALFEKGEPFPLFEEMIEGSHWVRLSDESL